jgi:hypothetical protein
MTAETLEGHLGTTVTVDICLATSSEYSHCGSPLSMLDASLGAFARWLKDQDREDA